MLSSVHNLKPPVTTTVVDVPITPSFILRDTEYRADAVSYDPATNVLMVQWDRSLATQSRRFVVPRVVDGHALSVTILSAPRGGKAVIRGGSIFLPALFQGEDASGELTFTPIDARPTAAKVKIKITMIGRPTGGG